MHSRLTQRYLSQPNSTWLRLLFFVLFLSLISCVNVSGKNQLMSNTAEHEIIGSELRSCQQGDVIQPTTIAAQGIDPENIAFLNWNIYKGNNENWRRDLSAFARTHHVMTIQEAMLSEELTALLDSHDFNWELNTAFHLNGAPAGVMNVARYDALHSCGFKIKEPIIRIPKSTLVSYYPIKGTDKKLLVANIHGINFTLGLSSYRQQLRQLYLATKNHDGPMIVAGDFNSWSSSRMAEVNTLVELLALSKLEYSVNNKTQVFGNAIDHVFYRELELVKHQVEQVSSSDHNPISVNFRYR